MENLVGKYIIITEIHKSDAFSRDDVIGTILKVTQTPRPKKLENEIYYHIVGDSKKSYHFSKNFEVCFASVKFDILPESIQYAYEI
jgi:hypothetical protein